MRARPIDAFFIELAARMTGQLDQLGFPLCRGGVMAINPVWRSPSAVAPADRPWIRRRSEVAMQLADVLFDFQSVFGERRLAEWCGAILELCRENRASCARCSACRPSTAPASAGSAGC